MPEILIIETYEKSIKMKQENLQFEGIVTQELGNSMFKVKLNVSSESDEVLCTISGKIRKNYIKILTGDGVKIEMTPYDLTRGRIVQRLTSTKPVTTVSNNFSNNKKRKK